MTAINTAAGQVAPGFEKVREAFIADHPSERGVAQLCVYRHGVPVVDIWTEREDGRGYDGDSLTVLMSCTKGAVAVLIHMLVERGDLRLEDRIADCWPEFAVNGKAEITIAHVLTHSTGLFAFDMESGVDGKAMLDQEVSAAALAAMTPFWEPGSAFLYHFVSYGVLLAEVVRRRTGRTIGQLFAELIAEPLGLDLWIGLPEAQETRVIPHLSPVESNTDWRRTFESLGIDPDARLPKTLAQTISDTGDLIERLKTREGRAPEVPAANAVGNARSLARMYAACVGEVDGIRLISRETLERVRSPRTDALGPPFPLTRAGDDPQRFGLGVELPRRSMPMVGPASFGHPGAGGRIAFANPDNGVAVSYACSAMLWDGRNPDPRWVGWNRALLEAIER